MKFFRILPVILFLVSHHGILNAQCFYGGIGGGYGFMAGSNNYGSDRNVLYTHSGSSLPDSTLHVTSRSYSLGKGINGCLYGGYQINRHLGVELGFSYLKGAQTSIRHTQYDSTALVVDDRETVSGVQFRITPALRFQTAVKKINVYMTAGMIIGVGSKEHDEQDYYGGNNDVIIYTSSGRTAFGFHASCGTIWMFQKRFGLFAEVTANFLNWAPQRMVMTTYTVNGVNELSTLNSNLKETDYYAAVNSNYSTNVNQPALAVLNYLPFSAIGFNFGIHFSLDKNRTNEQTL
jgi:hypothetical protein